ncbi:MAG: cryptochrome/photolyase family protein, partial [Burkholderiales bacterium]|nr:cryptochrome/photolyase family protein [Burkholderiales bacterium]
MRPPRGGTLAIVLGDQLDGRNPALAGLDPARDAILFVEAPEEAGHVWSHKARIAMFFAGMRHFADALRRGRPRRGDKPSGPPP